MKCSEIIKIIEKRYPPSLAAEWDNVGLIVGDAEKEVKCIYAVLDLTDKTIEEAAAAGADLIITHHPLIFRPVSRITAQDFIGRRIISLIRNGISYYAMHTNFDIAGMADRNARDLQLLSPEVLTVTCGAEDGMPCGFGRVGDVAKNSAGVSPNLREYAEMVKTVCALPMIRVYGDPDREIRRAAVSSGAGKSFYPDAIQKGADVLVTGDVDYHTALDAVMQGLCVIDAGHYGTEYCFTDEAVSYLREQLPGIGIFRASLQQPYHIL